ncbi:MAG: hypothetical protein MJK04_13920, partial [Psychrosphaera sp.]|nr:hypothetical protein [Psychrosphaera sp.]
MLNIDYFRKNGPKVQENCDQRGMKVDISQLLELDQQRRTLTAEMESVRAKSNQIASGMKKATPEERPAMIAQGKATQQQIAELDVSMTQVQS